MRPASGAIGEHGSFIRCFRSVLRETPLVVDPARPSRQREAWGADPRSREVDLRSHFPLPRPLDRAFRDHNILDGVADRLEQRDLVV